MSSDFIIFIIFLSLIIGAAIPLVRHTRKLDKKMKKESAKYQAEYRAAEKIKKAKLKRKRHTVKRLGC